MSDADGYVLSRVIITRTMTGEDGEFSDIVTVSFDGDLTLIEALGMIRMAEDSMLHGPDQADK